jgi:hypothetical protein
MKRQIEVTIQLTYEADSDNYDWVNTENELEDQERVSWDEEPGGNLEYYLERNAEVTVRVVMRREGDDE